MCLRKIVSACVRVCVLEREKEREREREREREKEERREKERKRGDVEKRHYGMANQRTSFDGGNVPYLQSS